MSLFEVLHDGASRPIIQTPDGRWLSISQFERGKWGPYDAEERDCANIVELMNFVLVTAGMFQKWDQNSEANNEAN